MSPTKEGLVAKHAFTETVSETTQVRAPWRTVVRTVFQNAVALAALAPVLITIIANGQEPEALGAWAVGTLTVSGIITKIMAHPAVEKFLRDHVSWLAAGAKD